MQEQESVDGIWPRMKLPIESLDVNLIELLLEKLEAAMKRVQIVVDTSGSVRRKISKLTRE